MSDDPKSKINLLRVPEFKSTIPDHFLTKLTEQERYIVQTLSKIEQENGWFLTNLVEVNSYVIDLDVRAQRIEQWKDRLTSKWTLILGGLALLGPLLLKELVDRILKH